MWSGLQGTHLASGIELVFQTRGQTDQELKRQCQQGKITLVTVACTTECRKDSWHWTVVTAGRTRALMFNGRRRTVTLRRMLVLESRQEHWSEKETMAELGKVVWRPGIAKEVQRRAAASHLCKANPRKGTTGDARVELCEAVEGFVSLTPSARSRHLQIAGNTSFMQTARSLALPV